MNVDYPEERLAPVANVAPVTYMHYTSPATRMNALISESGGKWLPTPRHDPDPYSAEADRLRDAGFPAAAELVAAKAKPKPMPTEGSLFSVAETILMSKRTIRFFSLDRSEIESLLQRSERGDFGVNGNAADPAGTPGIESAKAAKTGDGLVVSRFDCIYRRDQKKPATDGHTPRDVPNGNPHGIDPQWIEVVSLISPGREPVTCVHSSLG